MLRDDVNNALKDAMKAGDARRVSTLRLINATLKNADIELAAGDVEVFSFDGIVDVIAQHRENPLTN